MKPVLIGALVLLALFSVITLSLISDRGSGGSLNGCVKEQVESLLRDSARWGVMAEQTSNPLTRMWQVASGAAALQTARILAGDADASRVGGIDVRDLASSLDRLRTASAKEISHNCSSLRAQTSSFLSVAAGWT